MITAAVLFAALGLIAKGASTVAAKHAAGGVIAKLGGIGKLAAFPAAMFAICGALAAGAVAVELLLREVAIYAAVVLVPLVLAARIWPRLSNWKSVTRCISLGERRPIESSPVKLVR